MTRPVLPMLCAFLVACSLYAQDVPVLKTTRVYKTVAGIAIAADIHRSNDRSILPAILWIHGGALITGHRESINPRQLQRLINRGYAVVSIDYRLAPETKLPQILEDVRDAYAWMRSAGAREFHLDPTRIAIMGHSAGGYLTLMSGVMLKPAPRALVSFYGYGDIVGDWYSKPDPFYSKQPAVLRDQAYKEVGGKAVTQGEGARGNFYLYTRQNGLWPLLVTGHDPRTELDLIHQWCPVRHVTPQYPPAMLLHADRDTDVPYAQSVEMALELKRHGVTHELITVPGRGHGFDSQMRTPEISAIYDRALAFLEIHLRPAGKR